MKRHFTISDLDDFADICNELKLHLISGGLECGENGHSSSWISDKQSAELDKQMSDYFASHGPNSNGGTK